MVELVREMGDANTPAKYQIGVDKKHNYVKPVYARARVRDRAQA